MELREKGNLEYRLPEELYAKLVNQLKLAYLDMVNDRIDAVKSLDEIDSLECKYSFPDIECD